MCGITGYLHFGTKLETSNEPILRMLSLTRHRGPDDSGIVYVDTGQQRIEIADPNEPAQLAFPADLILGFNRLSILDLSDNGHQPMRSTDGSVILLMNGEIYNAFDFRESLQKKGHRFRSTTDTEVVLNLYLEYGFEQMIRMLNGMFAIVLYDAKSGQLILARDRFGIKPLYVLEDEARLAFSSEMKAFKALPDFRFELNENHLDELLLFRNLINRTLFRNVTNLTPGTYWTVDRSGETQIHIYHDLLSEDIQTAANHEVIAMLDQALNNSVQAQLMSDVKLGCQLSGGVDSSLVSYYAACHVDKEQLNTISIIFEEPDFSEEPYIDYAADLLNLEAHKFTLSADYYMEQFGTATWHFEQPLNHPNTIGIFLLSQEARKHVTVLLSGEGADEVLAGYLRFLDTARNPWLTRMFLSRLRSNNRSLLPVIRYYADPRLRMVMASSFCSLAAASDLKPDFEFDRAVTYRADLAAGLDGKNLRNYRQYEIMTYLPDLLMRQDKMSMASSIENRVPFLDNDLVATALGFPASGLIAKRDGKKEPKFALKELCASKFNEAFAFRRKMSFGIPLRSFMKASPFQEFLHQELLPGMQRRGLFQTESIRQASTHLAQASSDQLEQIWIMSSFESWAQQFLD